MQPPLPTFSSSSSKPYGPPPPSPPVTPPNRFFLLLSAGLLAGSVLLLGRDVASSLFRVEQEISFLELDVEGNLPSRGWKDAREWFQGGSGRSRWDWDAERTGLIKKGGWPGRGEGGKVRVLFLVDFKDYLTRMNTHTPELISAAYDHPYVETDVWGPGWKGWSKTLSISENLRNRRRKDGQGEGAGERELVDLDEEDKKVERGVGCGFYDLVWTISDIFKVKDPLVDNPGCGTLFAQQLGDCHSDDCINKWYAPHLNITVVKYAHELVDMFDHARIKSRFPEMEMQLFGVSSDSANRWDYFPLKSWDMKTVDAQGFGFDGSFYPIRTTVTNAVRNKQTFIKWYQHPGYTVNSQAPSEAPEWYEENSPLLAKHLELRGGFAGAMRETKICVFDASLERKLIRKYAQAFLSGCVVATDIPTDQEVELKQFVIELKPTWSIERINAAIDLALQDPEELQRKAMLAFAYARAHLTNGAKVEGMLKLWEGYSKKGWRGYDYGRGFSLRCRQYWAGENAYRPPWCSPLAWMGEEGTYDRAH
ncbi:hypothetical protein BDY24DRAFT_414418 [Mrakia frigida]|uniref:glycosyltransferase n=1 Tax=Mrakia frigida TaxID=29902 RepID=UPI003FCC17C4